MKNNEKHYPGNEPILWYSKYEVVVLDKKGEFLRCGNAEIVLRKTSYG